MRIWSSDAKRELDLDPMLDALAQADVVLVGETHLDAQTHRMERVLLEGLVQRKGDQVVLSMEMFERDVQPALDAYVGGEIDETTFLSRSRPWHNYRTGYRGLIETARREGLEVVAANLPVSLRQSFAMKKAAALEELDDEQRGWVATQIHPPAEAYWARLQKRLRDHGHGSMQTDDAQARLYSVQNLWDNTMAESIVAAWEPGRTVMHVAGAFHVERGLGIGHQIQERNPDLAIATVTIIPVTDLAEVTPGDEPPLADYEIYVPAQARGPSGGTYAVSMPTELRYHLDTAEGGGEAPLFVWLADDGARIEDALEHWRMVLGPQPHIVAVVPPYPRAEPDLRQAGQWSWPDSYAEDHGRLVDGIERIVGYLQDHFDVRADDIVIAGDGAGASVALWSALYIDDQPMHVIAIDPRAPDRFAEAGVPDETPRASVTIIADAKDNALVRDTLDVAGVEPDLVDAPNENLGWARAQTAIAEGLGLPPAPAPTRTIRMAVTVDTPLARQWGRMFAAAHAGVRIELDFGKDAQGEPIEVPPSVFSDGQHLPLSPGAFGGTTVLVLPDRIPSKTSAAWRALGEADVLQQRSRFHHLAVTELGGLAATLEQIEAANRRNVLIVPATFVAGPDRMAALREAAKPFSERLRIAWLPGLGSALAKATHDLAKGTADAEPDGGDGS